MAHGASVAVFIAQLVVLLSGGRLLGELMQRFGQPPVIGATCPKPKARHRAAPSIRQLKTL
jgi:hypothetical protein